YSKRSPPLARGPSGGRAKRLPTLAGDLGLVVPGDSETDRVADRSGLDRQVAASRPASGLDETCPCALICRRPAGLTEADFLRVSGRLSGQAPRWCNGSTNDSGSFSPRSNRGWGNDLRRPLQKLQQFAASGPSQASR